MAINLHFFRSNDLEILDFIKVFEFFEDYPNFKIFYGPETVEIAYTDEDFKFYYRYLITKKSRVNNIYKLNPGYTNCNFLLELPVAIPTFLAKEILAITQKICKLFELEIYHDSFDDVRAFNLVDVLVLFEETRKAYLEEYGIQDKIYMDHSKLNEICKYQRSVDSLCEYYHGEVDVPMAKPIIDNISGVNGISCTWTVGRATVFPPHVDYIYVLDDENVSFLVPRNEFYTIMDKYLVDILNFLPDMYLIKQKEAKKARKVLGKLRKYAITEHNFIQRRLCDYVDR